MAAVINVIAMLYSIACTHFTLPKIDEAEVRRAYARMHDMYLYLGDDLPAVESVVDAYPEPVMFRFVFDQICEWSSRLTKHQWYDLYIAMEGIVDVLAEARRQHNKREMP